MTVTRPVTSDQIRETFLQFFAANGHKRLSSYSLIPASNDPSALLTVAGMHPLKSYFLGADQPPASTVTTCQKCFRTEDLENVGVTARHLTFFEMLGNFSFGDYFKSEATKFAWELSTKGFGFDPDRVWITVFGGDEELGLGVDDDTLQCWIDAGVSPDRITKLGKEDNFWSAGPIGPCGPCTELYYDRGPEYGAGDKPGDPDSDDRFLEFWNLVLMQYERDAEGVLKPLPTKNIDTGMGLNRMAMLLQDKRTIFETDQFAPLIALGEQLAGKKYEEGNPEVDKALRVLADHARGMTMLCCDGVVPSNEGRGYVLRRIIRRAIVQARRIGIEGEVLKPYADCVIDLMGDAYPELAEERKRIYGWLENEEESFAKTLRQGRTRLAEVVESGTISGAVAFELYDTYGFPLDLTIEEYARDAQDQGHSLDLEQVERDFEALMNDQRQRSQAGSKSGDHGAASSSSLVGQISSEPSLFVGYTLDQITTSVIGLLEKDGVTYLKLKESPFYAEGGGQQSDVGTLTWSNDSCQAEVSGVMRAGDDQALKIKLITGELPTFNDEVIATVDRSTRTATQANHTATHLLHAALRQHLGDHVKQAGSSVGPEKLRFDFSHPKKLSADEVQKVEDSVNKAIFAADPVTAISTTLDEAKRMGAMALFGEKYGDIVRVVEVGDGNFSRELCGGTHVRNTSEIGIFKLVKETSSSSNVRRIEAITSESALRELLLADQTLKLAAASAGVSAEQLPETVKQLKGEVAAAQKAAAAAKSDSLQVTKLPVEVLEAVYAHSQELTGKQLADAADVQLRNLADQPAVVVLTSEVDGKVSLLVAANEQAVAQGVDAGKLVKASASHIGGGGGGRKNMAQAGGQNAAGLAAAVDQITKDLQR